MSKQIKLAIGSVLALATLVLITTGAASAQERSCDIAILFDSQIS